MTTCLTYLISPFSSRIAKTNMFVSNMVGIAALTSQYQLLELTSSYLTAVDLLNLALTCSRLYTDIRKSEAIFDRLKRVAICDGQGSKARQEYRGLYFIPQEDLFSRRDGPNVSILSSLYD